MSNQSYFNAKLWTVDQVLLWIKGLGEFANQYVGNFEKNHVDGCRLLILTNCDLIDMGINKLRDQEIILQGINLLQYMTYEMMNETLKTCASRLEVACTNLVNLIKHIDIKLNTETRDSRFVLESRMAILRSIENTLKCIFYMMSWINRLESDDGSNYEDEKQTLILCSQILSSCSKKDVPGSILGSACEQLIGMCLEVIQNSNDLLNSQPCSLDVVQINKQADQKLGLEIRCLINGTPYISLIEENSLSAASGEFEVKDEIIQVNDQTVLGWDVKILKQFIDSNHSKVKFTIKKKPELSYASSVARKFVKKKSKKVRIKDGTLTKDGICSSSTGNLLSRLEELSRKLSEVPPLSDDHLLQPSSPRLPREDRRPSLDGDGNPTSRPNRGRIRLRILPKFITKRTKKLCTSLESLLNNDSAPQSPNILRKVISNKGNKRMSCHDMGGTDCRGWVWVKQELKGASVFSTLEKWRTYWVVLKWRVVHFYKDPKDDAPLRSFSLMKCKFSPHMSQNKFSFKVWNDDDVYVFASETKEDMLKWMNKMALASLDDLNAEDLHTIPGFQTYHKKNESESTEVLSQQQNEVDKKNDTDDDDLKRWCSEIRRADIGLDGRNEKQRRSAILTASRSLKGHNNMNVLKLLSLNRMLKDKMQKLEAIENFFNQQPITPEALKEFQHHNPVCILDAASDIKITESDV